MNKTELIALTADYADMPKTLEEIEILLNSK